MQQFKLLLILSPVVWGTVEYLTGHFASSGRSETAFSRKEFSFTNSILHAGRLVTESLEKGQAHVLLHPVPKFQYAENLLLRCKGKKISSPPTPALSLLHAVFAHKMVLCYRVRD